LDDFPILIAEQRKTVGVKTAAVGDRAGFGSHLLSNLLSSTDEQRGARDRE